MREQYTGVIRKSTSKKKKKKIHHNNNNNNNNNSNNNNNNFNIQNNNNENYNNFYFDNNNNNNNNNNNKYDFESDNNNNNNNNHNFNFEINNNDNFNFPNDDNVPSKTMYDNNSTFEQMQDKYRPEYQFLIKRYDTFKNYQPKKQIISYDAQGTVLVSQELRKIRKAIHDINEKRIEAQKYELNTKIPAQKQKLKKTKKSKSKTKINSKNKKKSNTNIMYLDSDSDSANANNRNTPYGSLTRSGNKNLMYPILQGCFYGKKFVDASIAIKKKSQSQMSIKEIIFENWHKFRAQHRDEEKYQKYEVCTYKYLNNIQFLFYAFNFICLLYILIFTI